MALTLGLNLPFVEGSMDGATPRWVDIRAMATAGEEVGFDARSAEVLVRTIDDPDVRPAEEHELRGTPADIADDLRQYDELGITHLQVQLRPNQPDAVEAFVPVMRALYSGETATAG